MSTKVPNIRRKSILDRTASIITVNENNVEKINLNDYKLEYKIGKTNLGFIYIYKNKKRINYIL